jgi:hypothetical protein
MKARNVNVNTVPLDLVFEFLNPLVAEKKAGSTIRTYVGSLKYHFHLFQREDLVNSSLFNMFAEGAQ